MPSVLSARKSTAGSLFSLFLLILSADALASNPTTTPPQPPASTAGDSATADERITELSRQVAELKALVLQLQAQVSKQSSLTPAVGAAIPATPPPATVVLPSTPEAAGAAPAGASSAPPKVAADLLRGVTVNAMLDGYYEYNTNAPIGRVNTLRAYDVSSNSFSLNQADLILESAPDPAAGKRVGMRIDLQYGQATAALQGSSANELRPDVYRPIFQAYGTYIFPVGKGLVVDFGKWASSIGLEDNYTKDQLNYSRSFWYDYLPFYHTGFRIKYAINDEIAVNGWITNGTQQTEDFNNQKDELLGIVLTPTPALSWTLDYYQGQEHPDVVYLLNPGPGQRNLPSQQGTYILPIANAPDGRLHIFDSYASWQALPSLNLAAEVDYVQQRLYSYSAPQYVTGGALYGAYQLAPKVTLAARAEYLADVGGLYSGATQYLKEGTLTLDYRPADGFLMRGEIRRDQSNRQYFLSSTLGILEASQTTIGVGLVWWLGQKEGAW